VAAMARALMLQGTASHVGKSILAADLSIEQIECEPVQVRALSHMCPMYGVRCSDR